jgi:hypothetical protein
MKMKVKILKKKKFKSIRNIFSKSKENAKQKGNRISAYYLPELSNNVVRFCKEFLL